MIHKQNKDLQMSKVICVQLKAIWSYVKTISQMHTFKLK